jgi:serine/threonine protein kinase
MGNKANQASIAGTICSGDLQVWVGCLQRTCVSVPNSSGMTLPTGNHQLYREIKLQSELGEGHQNIITPEEVMLTSHYLGLVMEYAPGGSLTQYITQKFRECR